MDTNEQTADIAIETSIADSEQTAHVEEMLSEGSTTPIPGVISLIKLGFGIYKERIGALIGIGVLQFFSGLLISIAMFLLRGHVVIYTIAMFLLFLIGTALYFWFILSSMEIISGHTRKVSLRQALYTALPKTLPFIWMLIMAFLIVVGIGTLISILAFITIALLGLLGGMASLAITISGAVAAGASLLVVSVLFSIWFLFSYWVFVDEGERGVSALVASRELIRKNINAIFWRVFAATFLVYIVYYVVLVLNYLLFSVATQGVVNFLINIVASLSLVPITLGIIYELFRSVKARVGTKTQQNKKLHKYFTVYAVIGGVLVFLFVFLFVLIAPVFI